MSEIVERRLVNEKLLECLDYKLQQIRDRTRGVAEGFSNGLYLWGEGGTSKSYTVEKTLQALGKPYKLSNSRITGKGLFELLRDHPDAVHVLEDVETLFADKNSFGVLRSALWGQAGEDGYQERLVVWQTARGREEVIFTGGIILIANCSLDNLPQLRALKTRITPLHFVATNEEVAAHMRRIAAEGHRHGPYRLTPRSSKVSAFTSWPAFFGLSARRASGRWRHEGACDCDAVSALAFSARDGSWGSAATALAAPPSARTRRTPGSA
jgi:hypothetical protein